MERARVVDDVARERGEQRRPARPFVLHQRGGPVRLDGVPQPIVRYCDGGSFTGDRAEPLTVGDKQVFFRGARNLKALIAALVGRGLAAASTVLVGGCSAGGLSAYLHADKFAAALPSSVTVLALADGMFTHQAKTWDGQEGEAWKGFRWLHKAMNSSGAIPAACRDAHGEADAWKCLWGAEAAKYVASPLLSIASKYDLWHSQAVIGGGGKLSDSFTSAAKRAYWEAYATETLGLLLTLPSSSSAFLTGCAHHCQTGPTAPWTTLDEDEWSGAWSGTEIGGTTIEGAVEAWYAKSLKDVEEKKEEEEASAGRVSSASGGHRVHAFGFGDDNLVHSHKPAKRRALRWADACLAPPCAQNKCGNPLGLQSVTP